MKKLIFGLLCLVLILSCEIPQSVTVKGSPSLYVPLGSPFTEETKGLVEYIDPDGIRSMMDSEDANQVNVYEYKPGGNNPASLTYAVHYPIVEMQMNIGDYVTQAMKSSDVEVEFDIPDILSTYVNQTLFDYAYPNGAYLVPGGAPPQKEHQETTPLTSIPMEEMSKLVEKVSGGKFGLQITWSQQFEDSLRLYIPAFQIGTATNYAEGIKVGDKLQFSSESDFEPKQTMSDRKLRVYVQVVQPGTGHFKLEEVFEWTTAIINVPDGDSSLSGTFPIENSLGEFLGDNVSFKKIDGYIYVDGIDDTPAFISLKAGENELVEGDNKLTNSSLPDFPTDDTPFTGSFTSHSLANPIPLNRILETTNASLKYDIIINTITINKADAAEKKITADLVILVPLELAIDSTPSNSLLKNEWAKLDLGDGLFSSMSSDDLFARTGSDDNNLFDSLESVVMSINPLVEGGLLSDSITILDINSLAVSVDLGPGKVERFKLIKFEDEGAVLPLNKADIVYPFKPEFEILLKREAAGQPAAFRIKPAGDKLQQFDFNLAVEVKTDINQTIEF